MNRSASISLALSAAHVSVEKNGLPVPAPKIPRVEVMDELYDAVVYDKAPLHSGAWGLASLEAAIAIIDSAPTGRAVAMQRQVGIRQ